MLVLLVLGLLARAILLQGPLRLHLAESGHRDVLLRRATEAGVAYAQTRLRDLRTWKGGGATNLTVDMPDFKVVEDQGNVIGWLREPNGEVYQFRLRFNYQDGSLVSDGLPDPSPTHFIDQAYVSFNNLQGTGASVVPVANTTTMAVDSVPQSNVSVPQGVVVLFVEGIGGPALQSTTGPTNLRTAGRLDRRLLKVMLAQSLESNVHGASLMAAGDIAMQSANPVDVSVIGTSEPPRMRSKRGIKVGDAAGIGLDALNMVGEVGRDPSLGLSANVVGNVTLKNEQIGDAQDLFNLPWKDVAQADPTPTSNTTVQIPGGVYIFSPADNNFHYHDMTLTAYQALPTPKPSGVVLSPNFAEVRTPTNLANVPTGILVDDGTTTNVSTTNATNTTTNITTVGIQPALVIDKPLRVLRSSGGVQDIVVATADGRRLHSQDNGRYVLETLGPTQYTGHVKLKINNSVVSTPGDLVALCAVVGNNATVTCEGNAVMAASSVSLLRQSVTNTTQTNVTQSNGTVINVTNSTTTNSIVQSPPTPQSLSLYVKKDLTLSTFVPAPAAAVFAAPWAPAGGLFGELDLQGLIYTWGDAALFAANPDGVGTKGPLAIRGLFVAYGANPDSSSPGSWGKGRVQLLADSVNLVHDATKLTGFLDPLVFQRKTSITRLSYGFMR